MNPSPLNYWTSTLPRATEAVADNLGASSVYIYINEKVDTGLVIQRTRGFDFQPEGLGVAFFATGPGLGLIMNILTTLPFFNCFSCISPSTGHQQAWVTRN